MCSSHVCTPPRPVPTQLQPVATGHFVWRLNLYWEKLTLIVRPNTLATQWIDEANKFFDESDFHLVEFTDLHQFTDPENQTDRTVWLVRDPRIAKFLTATNRYDLDIPCLMADESHLYLRNDKSNRGKVYNYLLPRTGFVVHMSGTLFPLGPRDDGLRVLCQLGGEFAAQPPARWSPVQALQPKKLSRDWDVLEFRYFVTPFYLRRCSHSNDRPIIDEGIRAPVPFIEDPNDPKDVTGEYYCQVQQLTSDTFNQTGVSAIKNRANSARMFEWSSLCEEWYRIEHTPASRQKRGRRDRQH
jgi:hypothetical protein